LLQKKVRLSGTDKMKIPKYHYKSKQTKATKVTGCRRYPTSTDKKP